MMEESDQQKQFEEGVTFGHNEPKKEMEKVEDLTTMADPKVDLDLANSSAHSQVEDQDEARKSSVEQEMER